MRVPVKLGELYWKLEDLTQFTLAVAVRKWSRALQGQEPFRAFDGLQPFNRFLDQFRYVGFCYDIFGNNFFTEHTEERFEEKKNTPHLRSPSKPQTQPQRWKCMNS